MGCAAGRKAIAARASAQLARPRDAETTITPVVTTEGVGAAAFVRDHGLGAVTDGSPEALAREIAAWLARPAEKRSAVGERARRAVAEHLPWPRVAAAMAEVYRWVVGGGPRPACVVTS